MTWTKLRLWVVLLAYQAAHEARRRWQAVLVRVGMAVAALPLLHALWHAWAPYWGMPCP